MKRTKQVGACVAAVLLVALVGCKERTPAEGTQTTNGRATAADALVHAEAPPDSAPEPARTQAEDDEAEGAQRSDDAADAGSTARALPPPDPKDLEGDLLDFAGFSRDESLFAFTRYAEAAGLHLLTVVQGEKGEVKHRFQLSDEASTEGARAFLKEHGFSRREGTLPEDLKERLQLRVQDGKAKVVLQPSERGGQKTLYEGDPFAQPNVAGGVKSVEKGMVSPSGRKLALRVEQVPVTEWGGIVSYIIVEITSP